MKVCPDCERELPESDYYTLHQKPHGRRIECQKALGRTMSYAYQTPPEFVQWLRSPVCTECDE